jgi:hypothetical protein
LYRIIFLILLFTLLSLDSIVESKATKILIFSHALAIHQQLVRGPPGERDQRLAQP